MLKDQINSQDNAWKGYEKILFRLSFIYFFLQVFPLDWKYYRHLFSINWFNISFAELFQVAKYTPQFVSGSYHPQDWGLATFADWLFILVVSLVGTAVWSVTDKKSTSYTRLYAWLRILVRYRLGIAVIAYGFLKLFAIQAPYPSLSSLNTPYGDFTTWKLFSLSLGIVPGYQAFLGAVELIAGILLLFRRTTVIGATIIIFFTGNVFMSNLAYEGGEVVYSFYLVTLALFLIVYDLQRIISLIILHIPVAPAKPAIVWSNQLKTVRLVLKSALVLVFVVIYGFSAHGSAAKGGYHFTHHPGIKGLKGLYTVVAFKLNGEDRPYSLTDSLRWQDVVFEKWASFSIKINQAQPVLNDNVESIPVGDAQSYFEAAGTRGRVYYNFKADTAKHTLLLINASKPSAVLSDDDAAAASGFGKYTANHASTAAGSGNNATQIAAAGQLSYQKGPDSTILISGVINGNHIEAVLQKNPKKYLLKAAEKGRSKGLKL
ncbi:MAG: DoxX family protein [Pedobacter sp.]|uniref:DoxX family protein n=1 Tax=Pedobacter sp. TaxID=1411316 RepID=UPI003397B011